jgi:hypothetical protein
MEIPFLRASGMDPRPGLGTHSGVGLVSSVMWMLKPLQGYEMYGLPTIVLVQRQGMGAIT